MPEYLLTREPWLPVTTATGPDTVGLIDAFEGADQLMIAPGGPLEERAVHRLLTAISYAALGAPSQGQYPLSFDGAAVAQWLRNNEAQFDLLSPDAPFGQDASLADETGRAHVVSMANLDTTVARSRPLLTDHRTSGDVPSVPLAEAVIMLLVYNCFDAPGIHEGVKTSSGDNHSLKGTEGSTLAFIPKGTLSTVMSWSLLPSETLGSPHWTYTGPGAVEETPEGDLDALTWHYRRLLLHHDGQNATGVQVHQGRSMQVESKKAAADTAPGRRHYVVSANDVKTAAATGEIGAPTSPGRGNPLALIGRWEAGSSTSLSGHIREALARDPHLAAPRIVTIGQRLENTALKVLTREVEVPHTKGGYSEQASQLQQARTEKRLFPSDDHRALPLLDLTDPADLDSGLDQLRIRPDTPEADWPTNARLLSTASSAQASTDSDEASEAEATDQQIDAEDLLRLAMVVESEDRSTPNPGSTETAGTLRRIRHILRSTPEVAAQLSRDTATRIPTPEDLSELGLPALTKSQRLWAGLLAIALNDRRHAADGTKPLPTALRQAGARLSNFPHARDTLHAATMAPDIEGARAPLVDAIALMGRSATRFSWWSLADDLDNWSPQIRHAWHQAFSTKTPTPDPASTTKES